MNNLPVTKPPSTPIPHQLDAMLDHALAYAERGWCVFPLSPGAKVPIKGSGGFYDAANNPDVIREWWNKVPDANVAIATGLGSVVFVVDEDKDLEKGIDGNATIKTLEKELGKLPTTYTVLTPRGGRHLYFRMPDRHPIESGTNILGPGVDIRGDKGYVVAPPSKVNGNSYKVLNATAPAMPPSWLVELVRAKGKSGILDNQNGNNCCQLATQSPDEAKLRDALSFISASVPHDEWVRVGMALHQWNSVTGLCLWDEWSKTCPEKYDAKVVATKWRSFHGGAGNGAVTVGTLFHMAQQAGWKGAGPIGPTSPKSPALPEIIDAVDFLAHPIIEPPELVWGILHQGSKMVFGGGSKTFKTWTLLDLAVSVAAGEPWLSFKTTRGKVLFLNFEIAPAFFQRRIQAITNAKGITLAPHSLDVWNLRGRATSYFELLPLVRARIKDAGYSLLVLDPIYKLYGNTDENSAGEVARLMNALELVTVDTGASIGFGAHYAKGNAAAKETIDRISGSGVFARDPDSILNFTRHEEDDAFTVEATLRNHPPIEPFVCRWQFPLMRRDDGLDPAKLKQAGGRPKLYTVERLLSSLKGQQLNSQNWLRIAGLETGISKSRFFALLEEAKQNPKLKQTPSGQWFYDDTPAQQALS